MAQPRGADIRERRISLGMRRKELAHLIGKSYAHVANIENGHTTAAPETLTDIAKVLRMGIGEANSDWTGAA